MQYIIRNSSVLLCSVIELSHYNFLTMMARRPLQILKTWLLPAAKDEGTGGEWGAATWRVKER